MTTPGLPSDAELAAGQPVRATHLRTLRDFIVDTATDALAPSDQAADAAVDRAEADGRLLSPEVAAATYRPLATDAAALLHNAARAQAVQGGIRRRTGGAVITGPSAGGAASTIPGAVFVRVVDPATGVLAPIFRWSRGFVRQSGAGALLNETVQSFGIQGPMYDGGLDLLQEVVYSGKVIEFQYRAVLNSSVRFYADGQLISNAQTLTDNNGDQTYVTLTFDEPRSRLIAAEWGSDARPRAVFRESTATLSKPVDPLGPRVVVIGDSYTSGTGAPSRGRYLGYHTELGRLMGWRDIIGSGAGGAGYLAGGDGPATFPNFPKYRARLATDVTPFSPDIVIVTGGQNDQAFTETQVRDEARLLFDAIRTALPDTEIVSVLPFATSGSPSAALLGVRAGVRTAALERGLYIADPIGEQWITGTGRVGATNGTGNADIYVGNDAAHPSPAGHDYLARRLAAHLRHLAA